MHPQLSDSALLKGMAYINGAVNDSELDPGVYAIAAPVFLSDGEILIGSLAIVGIRDRLLEKHSETEIANSLLEATTDLSRLINNIDILPGNADAQPE